MFSNSFIERMNFVKQELNCIYTEAPFNTSTGLDFGWFCREHSLHVYLIGKINGFKCSIIEGDIYVKLNNSFMTTLDSSVHYWCLYDKCPIDLSFELKFFKEYEKTKIIIGTQKKHGKYNFRYIEKQRQTVNINELANKYTYLIAYLEKEKINFDPLKLINNPYLYLIKPDLMQISFSNFHGEDIFDKITLHCQKILTEGKDPFSLKFERNQVLNYIKEEYVGATQKLQKLL